MPPPRILLPTHLPTASSSGSAGMPKRSSSRQAYRRISTKPACHLPRQWTRPRSSKLAGNCASGRANLKSTWTRSRTPDLSQKRCLRGQVVTDRGRGDTAFAHGVADLIQAQHDIASSIERSEEHTSELQSLMRTSYAVFCFKQKKY